MKYVTFMALLALAAARVVFGALRHSKPRSAASSDEDEGMPFSNSKSAGFNDEDEAMPLSTNTTRSLVPSSKGGFKDMCTKAMMKKRRLFRDDFSNQIYQWVTDELIAGNEWDAAQLKRVRGQTGHLPDFHRLPKGVISSFVLKTCPIYTAEESNGVSNVNAMPNLIYCRDPLKHERVPSGIYMPVERVVREGKEQEVRSICHNVWAHWEGIVEDCTRTFRRQDLISVNGGSGRNDVDNSDLRFSKCSFDSSQPQSYKDSLPLTAEDFPLTTSGYQVLRHSNCVSPTLQSDFRVKGSVSNWVNNVMGGSPPHPENNEQAKFWNIFEQVLDLQIERKAYGQTKVNRIFKVPDLWGEFTLNDAAVAVHNEFPGKWQSSCIEDFLKQKVKLDSEVMPKRANVDFISSVVSMAHLNTWSIDTIAATSFATKYYAGRIRPEEIAWKISTGEVRDGVPQDIIRKVQDMKLKRMEDFTAYAEGCPSHPAWPAMHSAGSTMSLWMGVVCDLTSEQLRQAQLTDFAVAYSRSVAGVHYFDDNLAGLRMGQEIIAQELPSYMEKTYGSDPRKVRKKIRELQFEWKNVENDFLNGKWRY